jgi:uncharacterized membrane protein YvlD (DUF360 family)
MSIALQFLTIWFLNLVALVFTRVLVPGIKIRTSSGYVLTSLVFAIIGSTAFPLLGTLGIPILLVTLWFFHFFAANLILYVVSAQVAGVRLNDSSSAYLGSLIIATTNWLISVLSNLSHWIS